MTWSPAFTLCQHGHMHTGDRACEPQPSAIIVLCPLACCLTVTSLPTLSTTPPPSCPRITGNRPSGSSPLSVNAAEVERQMREPQTRCEHSNCFNTQGRPPLPVSIPTSACASSPSVWHTPVAIILMRTSFALGTATSIVSMVRSAESDSSREAEWAECCHCAAASVTAPAPAPAPTPALLCVCTHPLPSSMRQLRGT